MTDIETRISNGLNRSIDQIKPELFDRITAAPQIDDTKSTSKRASAFTAKRVRAALKPVLLTALGAFILIRFWGYIVGYSVPHGRIYINEDFSKSSSAEAGFKISGWKYLEPGDISQEFGFDPLENMWVPQGLKTCYGEGEGYNEGYYLDESKQKLAWMGVYYRENPDDLDSKGIRITLTHQSPMRFDIEPTGFTRISKINNTEVTVTHVDQKEQGDYYCAKFSYQNVGYCIDTLNGVTKEELMHVITSIICS